MKREKVIGSAPLSLKIDMWIPISKLASDPCCSLYLRMDPTFIFYHQPYHDCYLFVLLFCFIVLFCRFFLLSYMIICVYLEKVKHLFIEKLFSLNLQMIELAFQLHQKSFCV